MKSNAVFYINEGMVKFLQVSMPKKQVIAADAINTANQSPENISETLAAFVKQRKLSFSESRVTILIPRSGTILRYMSFPSHNEDEIASMIDLQVGSRIPYVREEVEIDFQILSKTEDGYAKVAVVIIPQDVAMRYWKIFADAGIPVHGITISSIGLWLLYQQHAGLSDKPGAIFDLDVDRSEICLCYKTHWLASRELPIGFTQMQRDGYAEILNQWELTQSKISNDKPGGEVGSVYLVCSANRAYALGIEMAKAQNELVIKEVFLTQALGVARGFQWPKIITDDGVSIASLAGIAFSTELPPIDLIPRAVRETQERRVYQRQLMTSGIWVGLALISLGLAFSMGFLRTNIQLARLEKQLRDTKQEAFKVQDQLEKIHDIEGMISGRMIFSDLAHEIYRLLPAEVYLVDVSISEGHTLSLEGVATNSVDINQFQKDMVDSQSFSNVSLDYVNKRVTQQGEVDYFKITCTFNPGNSQK